MVGQVARGMERMALDGDCTPASMLKQIVREYLNLADNAKEALPKNQLRRLAIRTKNMRS